MYKKRCLKCDANIDSDLKFCPNCGSNEFAANGYDSFSNTNHNNFIRQQDIALNQFSQKPVKKGSGWWKVLLAVLIIILLIGGSVVGIIYWKENEANGSEPKSKAKASVAKNDDKNSVQGEIEYIPGDAVKIIGVWKGEVDFTDLIKQTIEDSDSEMSAYFTKNVALKITYEFKNDNTYFINTDTDTFTADLKDGFNEMTKQYITDYAKELDMTYDEFSDAYYEQTGTTFEEVVSQAINAERIASDIKTQIDVSGKYSLEDGKLYISNSLNEPPDTSYNIEYVLEEDSLKLKYDGTSAGLSLIMPIELERQ